MKIIASLFLLFSFNLFAEQLPLVTSGNPITKTETDNHIKKTNQLLEKDVLVLYGGIQQIPTGVDTIYKEWNIRHQQGAISVNGTGHISVTKAGFYHVSGVFIIADLGLGESYGNLVKRDSQGTSLEAYHMAGERGQHGGSALIYLEPGQTLTMELHNGSTTVRNSGNNGNHTHMSIYYIGDKTAP